MKTTIGVPLVRERSTVQSCPAAPFSSENPTSDRQASAEGGRTCREPGTATVGKSLDERARLESLLTIALQQFPHKKTADEQAAERRFMARDLARLEALRNGQR